MARRRALSLVAGAALAGAGAGMLGVRAIASRVTRVRTGRRLRHRIVAVEGDAVVLVADEETVRPGRYGIFWRDGRAVLGEVLARGEGTVTRRLESVDVGEIAPGRFGFGHLLEGDPTSALSLVYAEPKVPTDVGELPLWEISGARDDWVLLLHGYRGSRTSALSFIPMLRALDLSILVVSYRNDPDAPPGHDAHYHLGADEWQEVEAAVAYARRHGARRVVLFGWSMGAAIALQAYDKMADRGLVAGLILDSPVLDWRAVLLHQARKSYVPRLVMSLALRRVAATIGLDYPAFDWVARSGELTVPVLIFHSSNDPTVPAAHSRELARRRADLVTHIDNPLAGHVGTFNVDPIGYEREVVDFLEQVLPAAVADGDGERARGRSDSPR